LQSLQASDIDNIEIINNPGVQFDAEGNAGVINIVLKRQKGLGTNGNVSLGYSIGERARYDGSIGLNHRGKKFNVFGNYSHFNGINKSFNHFYREQFGRSFDQLNDNLSDSQNHGLRFGADWFLNGKHTLGVLVNGNLNKSIRNDFSNTPILVLSTNELESRLIANTVNDNNSQNYTANLNYQFKPSDSLRVSVDLDYGTFNNLSDVDQPNRYYSDEGENLLFENIYEQETEADISLASAKTDFTLLGLGGTLSFGAKGAQVTTNNRFDFFNVINDVAEIDTNRTNTFRYEEQVLAGYINYERKLNDKWGINGGARLEFTDAFGELTSLNGQSGEGLDTNYVNLFPSLGFSYAPNQKHSFSLGYGKRIERPNYQSLNPFESQIDELSFEKGNPFLRPQFTHNVSLSHTYQYRFTTSLTYSRVLDGFARWTDTRDENATFITSLNLATQDIVSLNFSAPITITKKWSSFTNLGGNYNHNQSNFGENRVVDIKVFSANVYMQHSYQFTDSWKLELSGLYSSPGLWQGIFKTRRYWFVDVGVQKQLWDGKANLRFALDDIFFSRQWAGTMNYGNLNLQADGGSDSRRFKVNFTYKFGDSAVKKARRRSTGLESESKRAGGS